jgi:hypothetical protein
MQKEKSFADPITDRSAFLEEPVAGNKKQILEKRGTVCFYPWLFPTFNGLFFKFA